MPDRTLDLPGPVHPAIETQMLQTISAELLLLYGDQYGRAPTRARTFINEDVLTCVLQEDVFDAAEVAAVGRGDDELVLEGRVEFQRRNQTEFIAVVERLTGRTVRTFLSANQTRPGVAAELFILDH